jgi:hypothetical protein
MQKTLLVLPGYLVGLGGLVVITYRTLVAVFSGSGSVLVQVNRFGEQYLDLVGLVFLWVVCVVGVVSLTLLVREKTKEKEDSAGGTGTFSERKPVAIFEEEAPFFSEGSSGVLEEGVARPFVMDESRFFFGVDEETNAEWSFSVQVVSRRFDEENRY